MKTNDYITRLSLTSALNQPATESVKLDNLRYFAFKHTDVLTKIIFRKQKVCYEHVYKTSARIINANVFFQQGS